MTILSQDMIDELDDLSERIREMLLRDFGNKEPRLVIGALTYLAHDFIAMTEGDRAASSYFADVSKRILEFADEEGGRMH